MKIQPWIKHSGGKCPVPPETLVEFPCGTYAPTNDRGTLGPVKAGDVEWRWSHTRHIRDDIHFYRIWVEGAKTE